MSVSTPENKQIMYVPVGSDRYDIFFGTPLEHQEVGSFDQNADGIWSLWLVDAGLGWTKVHRKELNAALRQLNGGVELIS